MIYHPRRPIGMVENFRRAAFCRIFISYRSLVSENDGFHLEGLDEVEQSIVICQWWADQSFSEVEGWGK